MTYRKSGQPMPSPVNFCVSDGKLYLRSERDTGKVTRLRNPRVLLVPCGLRGKPTGEAVAATGRILPSEEAARADAIVAANWSPGMRLVERSLDVGAKVFEQNTVYIAFTPDAE